MSGLRPREYHKSIFALNLDKLKQKGFRAILLDLDNTLVQWNDPNPTPALRAWLDQVREKGFQVCIISNNSGSRVSEFAAKLGVPFVPKARKPSRKGFLAGMEKVGVIPSKTVVVGDQIFTDVLGGNRAGAYTVLVVPIDPREFFFTRMVRQVERFVLRYLNRRGLLIEK